MALIVTCFLASGAAVARAKTKAQEDEPAGLAKILGEESPEAKKKERPMPITGYEIAGNQNVSEQVILLSLESKIGKPFSQELVDRDVRALKNLGYFSTIVPQITPYQNGVKIIYRVVENPYINDVRIMGNTVVTTAEILKALNVKRHAILNVGQLQYAIKRINKLYSDKGYAFCGVLGQDQFSINPDTQVLRIRIAEPKLKEIKVTGNRKTKTRVITREFDTVKVGKLVKTEDLKLSLRNVYNLGYFEDVKPPEPKLSLDKQYMTLEMEVKEQKTGQASFGGGYSSINGMIGFVDLAETNFRGNGQTLRARVQFGGEQSYILSFNEPWFEDKPIGLGLSLYETRILREEIENRAVVSQFFEKRTGGSITAGWRLGRTQRLASTFVNENINVNGTNGSTLPPDLQRLDIHQTNHVEFPEQSIRLTWTDDQRDNALNPHTGQRLSVTGGVTGVFLKGPNGFYQETGDYRAYHTFEDVLGGVTLAGRARAGYTQVVDGELRFVDRYALGGTDTLRGFDDREFTGQDFVLANLEVRKQFTKVFGMAAFIDSGDAYGSDGQPLELHTAYGLGLRLNTPLGPFRLDYGWPTENRSGQFVFGIGQQF